MPNSQKLIIDFGFYQICQIFAKLFAKKTWRGGPTNLKFCVLANQLVPKKREYKITFLSEAPFMGQISDKYFLHHFHLKICSEIFAVTFKRYIQLVLKKYKSIKPFIVLQNQFVPNIWMKVKLTKMFSPNISHLKQS